MLYVSVSNTVPSCVYLTWSALLFIIFQENKGAQSTDEKILVRGRVYDGNKPQTFNQSWTDEEQRK